MRVFAAIKINPLAGGLLNLFYELKRTFTHDRINWVKEDNIHITLKFYGEIYNSQVDEISGMLKNVCEYFDPFTIELKKLGVFGSRYNPRVVWIGVENSRSLIELGNEIHEKSQSIGFIKDRQNFVPHLTLGRIKQIENKGNLEILTQKYTDKIFQNVLIDHVLLYESKLYKTGPQYHVLNKFDLLKSR